MSNAIEISPRCASAPPRRRPSAPPLNPRAVEPVRIKTADVYTVREVTRIRQGIEPLGEVSGLDEYFWAELLKDCAEADVFEAVWAHYRSRARRLWPVDIVTWVEREAARRQEAGHEAWREGRGIRLSAGWGARPLAQWDEAYQTEIARGSTHANALAVADRVAESLVETK